MLVISLQVSQLPNGVGREGRNPYFFQIGKLRYIFKFPQGRIASEFLDHNLKNYLQTSCPVVCLIHHSNKNMNPEQERNLITTFNLLLIFKVISDVRNNNLQTI